MDECDKRIKRLCRAIARLRAGRSISQRAEEELGFVHLGVILALPDSDTRSAELKRRRVDKKIQQMIKRNQVRVQKLHFDLMRIGFGKMLANEIISDLGANRRLWCAAMTKRQVAVEWIDLIDLRDMPMGFWNVRNLWIYAAGPDCEKPLEKLAGKWEASDFKFVIDPQAEKDRCDLGTSELAFVAWCDWG